MASKNELNLKLSSESQLSSPVFKQEAYDIYKELREYHPVYPLSSGEQSQSWLITRYEDAISLLKDAKLMKNIENVFSNKEEVDVPISLENRELLRNHMLNSDPPDHNRLRSLAQKAFTPKMISQLEDQIQYIADTLLNKLEHNNSINLVSDYAFPLPIMVISEMLGVPLEDQHKFKVWSQAIIDTPHTLEDMQKNNQKLGEFAEYIQHLVNKKREKPADDLISALIKAESEGTKLNASELYSTITLLIVAGHETTVNLITNMTLALLEHPVQLQKLRQNSDLIDLAIEEALRFYSPVELTTLRWTAETFTMHGQDIQSKDRIIISLASSNRDEKIFPNADIFDITRKNNRHIAFGHGSHFCLGASLARLEAKIAISSLLQRIPNIQMQRGREQVRWKENYLMRSLEELPLKF
ncbi:cytochrome P450 family protein [Bacillus pseudomycoides]|uniref:cytochrome P450 family protein n=1 Tax=Bacillus pseudomycoides TaxID=64104 RepID=UPI000BF21D83|nr:cytochrome P450 [Bacillus pseudomycoides]PEI31976.1 cytochrome P450 [Bacillus pseudomycoides]PGA73548.1 cytochrome P450 [Bacillus pseudomycoides]PHA83145.1 cytochrome P450 [Bacillus pseudomycoides]PHC68304.1 cytochrome P450 [Bacillus pseudomycoides]PHE13608.1 cytochrome P450 [Bacillus pseudomycoides]